MKRPVFVVGCPRSGTTLLYSMLVAAGGFAIYRKETYFYAIAPRFPNLQRARYQQTFMREFLQGSLGKVPGVDVERHVRSALSQCVNTGDFLPRLMDGITRVQGAERWVEGTPIHVLHIKEIKRAVPDALFGTRHQGWKGLRDFDRQAAMGGDAPMGQTSNPGCRGSVPGNGWCAAAEPTGLPTPASTSKYALKI